MRSSSSRSSSSSSKAASSSSSQSESERLSRQLRDCQSRGDVANKQCLECGQRGPTYVNMTVGAFVCTKCSGMLRGINPPHRIKSMSMSSFSADEVSFVRARGNTYCSKVWLGLLDDEEKRAKLGKAVIDDEHIKAFIIEKYERKRYYVDPSTITHSFTPSSSSPPAADTNSHANDPKSNLIGSALNARRAAAAAAANSTAAASSSSSSSSSSVAASNSSPAAISRPGNAASAATPAPVTAAGTAAAVMNGSAQLAKRSASRDSFGLSDAFGGSPIVATPPQASTVTATPTATPSNNTTSTTTTNAPGPAESFANFDAAQFDSPPVEPLPPAHFRQSQLASGGLLPAKASPISGQSNASRHINISGQKQKQPEQQPQDRYAALKDLDEIFKSSVAIQDSPTAGQTTGVSLFGSSPVQAAAVPPPQAPPTTGPQDQDSVFNQAPQWSQQWPQQQQQQQQHRASPDNWAFRDQQQSRGTMGTGGSSSSLNSGSGTTAAMGATSPPVNPFTGATNLTQLNTSPWPTTGTSPVNAAPPPQPASAAAAAQWPPMPGAVSATVAAATTTNANQFSNFGGKVAAGAANDPFAATNLQADNNDLFANAPKPFNMTTTATASTMMGNGQNGQNGDIKKNGIRDQTVPADVSNGNTAANGNFQAFFQTMSATATTAATTDGAGSPWPPAQGVLGTSVGATKEANSPWPPPAMVGQNMFAAAAASNSTPVNSKNPFL